MPIESGKGEWHDGFALVAILVFMLIIAAILTPFALNARTNLMIAHSTFVQERMNLLADGLTNVTSAALAEGLWTDDLPTDLEPVGCRVHDLTIEVRVQDHNGLIDLNAADSQLLTIGFVAAGIDKRTAEEVASDVVRYRTRAAVFESAKASKPVSSSPEKLAPFESVAELSDFEALRNLPLATLQTIFTVNSKRGTVVLLKATRPLERTLAGAAAENSFILKDAPKPIAYTVAVVIKGKISNVAGQAGYIVERDETRNLFHRVASYSQSEFTDSPIGEPIKQFACERLFGSDTATLLRDLGA